MSKPKTERNALLLKLNKKGYSYRQIFEELQKKGFSGLKGPKSVGMQLSRLRKGKKPIPTSPSQRIAKTTLPRRQVAKETATRQPISEAAEKAREYKMAFWLDPDMKEKLKIQAVKQKKTASEIVREILKEYLKDK